jgi:hypothetical protein
MVSVLTSVPFLRISIVAAREQVILLGFRAVIFNLLSAWGILKVNSGWSCVVIGTPPQVGAKAA